MDLIKGKIASIVNEKYIVINKGQKHGVTEGMIFFVRLNMPDIIDPDDEKNILTGIYFEKGRIRITNVYENMSFALLLPTKTTTKSSWDTYTKYFQQTYTLETYPDVDKDVLMSSSDWQIKKGDEVMQVNEDIKVENES